MGWGPKVVARALMTVLLGTSGACTLLNPISGLAGHEVDDAGSDDGVGLGDAADSAQLRAPDADADADNDDAGTDGPSEAQGPCPCTLLGEQFRGTASDVDTASTEVGTRFRSDVQGKILAIRYYRGGPENEGLHLGSLWTNDGQRIATVEFTNETPTGWQTATFASPVPIAANTPYIVSYRAPKGHYASTSEFFAQPLDAPPLHADVGAGVYTYDEGVPKQLFKNTNYWVDVVFSP